MAQSGLRQSGSSASSFNSIVEAPHSTIDAKKYAASSSGGLLDTGNTGYKAMDKLKQRVSDVVFHKKNRGVLRTKIQALKEAVSEVEPLLRSGGNDHEDEVHEWFAKASGILHESDGILEGRSNMVDKKRLCSTCFDLTPSWETGQMLREAEQVLEDKVRLDLEDKVRLDLEDNVRLDLEQNVRLELASYSRGLLYCNNLQSREAKLDEILEALMDIDIELIGISGMIGVGKTVLARELARRAQDNQLFDYTVLVQVSECVDVKSIQSQISKRIGLELSEADDEETRVCRLSNALEQKTRDRGDTEPAEQSKILVILDGLQHVIDLVNVGITIKSTQKRTVLLLSRNPDICKKMGAEKIFPVECLDVEESRILFQESLKDKMQSMEITLIKYKYLEYVMLMKCEGLPLIICSLACVLRPMSWYNWETSADQLLKHSFLEVDEVKKVPSAILELCNNYIRKGDQHKIFLICCLIHGRGVDICLEKLMRYGVGFGLFASDSFTNFDEWAHELKSQSLLLETKTQHVKIPEVLHTVGISALSQGDNKLKLLLDVGTCCQQLATLCSRWASYEKYIAISMMSDRHCQRLNWLQLNNLQALLLKDLQNSSLQGNFFQGMPGLKVLEISGTSFVDLPTSIGDLKSLITLILEYCDLQREIISTISTLDKLEVLSLRGSRIVEIPEEIGKLTNLRVLDLTRCKALKTFCVGAVAKMVQLKELYLDDDRKAWKINDIKNMSCTTDDMSSSTSSFASLRRFNICIGWQCRDLEDMSQFSRLLLIHNYTVPLLLKSSLRGLLSRTDFLQIDRLNGSSNSLHDFCKDEFSHLKRLHIARSQLKLISEASRNIFPQLEILNLELLPELTSICSWESHHNSFPQLRELRVKDLDNLAPYVLPAQTAVRLRIMEVSRCSNLRYIFSNEINADTDGADSCLEVLELKGLRNLQALKQPTNDSIKRDELRLLFNGKIKLPALKTIWVESLELIESFWDLTGLQQISQPCGTSPQCGNLKSMTITHRNNSDSLFPSTIVKSLLQLETLMVLYCGKLREVITSSSSDAENDGNPSTVITFPRLKVVQLMGLPELHCFYRGQHFLDFPVLKELKLEHLGKMKAFSLPVLEGQHVMNLQDSPEEIMFLFTDKVNFYSLETMRLDSLAEMNNLREFLGSKNFAAGLPDISSPSAIGSFFGNLKDLTICNCSHLESLLPCRILNSLVQLESLHVHTCENMKEIIPSSTDEDADTTPLIALPRLRVLQLNNMSSLQCFYRGLHFLILPMLKELHLADLMEMKAFTLPLAQPVEGEGTIFFDFGQINISSLEHLEVKSMGIELLESAGDIKLFSLKKLELHNLKKLKMIQWNMLPNLHSLIISDLQCWTSLISTTLLVGGGVFTKLEYMKIEKCLSLEGIVSREELREGEDQDFVKYGITLFPSLKEIQLFSLPRFESFSLGSYEVHFPSLEIVEISICQSFSLGRVRTPRFNSVKCYGEGGPMKSALIHIKPALLGVPPYEKHVLPKPSVPPKPSVWMPRRPLSKTRRISTTKLSSAYQSTL